MGDFELVAPTPAGGLVHFERNNDAPGLPWSGGETFGTELGQVNGAVVTQTSYGNLEVVAVAGSTLYWFWKNGQFGGWSAPFAIPGASNERGTPGFVQGTFGVPGNLEVAVPSASGGIDYFWRDNSQPSTPWNSAGNFASTLGLVDDVVMFESRQGTMEVAARVGTNVYSITRDTSFIWGAPIPVAQNANGRPGFIQSGFGSNGNLELIVPSTLGGYDVYSRGNDPIYASSNPWATANPAARATGRGYGATVLFESNFGPAPGNFEVFSIIGSSVDEYSRENVSYPTPFTSTGNDLRFIGPLEPLGVAH
jgi:hypothetical protein